MSERELMCPLCGYETVVFDEGDKACPNDHGAARSRLQRRLNNSEAEWLSEGPVMLPVGKAEKYLDTYRMLGVVS